MRKEIPLTEQQKAVVNHNEGAALVFAVAGAGKTTAMVHRIERLVRDDVFRPSELLATSFGRANVRDLKVSLANWSHCNGVDTRTLHSLGRDIIKQAQQMGYLRNLRLNGSGENGSLDQRLLSQTLADARRQNVPYKRELDSLDRQDFLDYIGQCKGQLLYADLRKVELPEDAFDIAGQAVDPSEQLTWYLDLYRLYEETRLRQGAVTFADMLLTGWEVLVSFPEVCERVQQRYKSVLVDEYQDINLAQSEMLHLITQPHGNYMAIGDDDQTIYEWRGASPHFILDFPKRYEAQTYLISDNFRCPATPLVLANRVIERNKERQPKRLSLTRGFYGETAVSTHTDLNQMSEQIVRRIRKLHKAKRPLNDMAVLVRLNAQTPPIEQELIAHNIPYRVSQPFYERNEIKTLIQYCRIAWIEKMVRDGKRPLISSNARHTFEEAWRNICNRPKRYINTDMRRQLFDAFVRQEHPPSIVLSRLAEVVQQLWLQDPLHQLADDIAWLANQLDKPAHKALRQLDIRLDYQSFLRNSSGFRQTGEGRAISVQVFIDYAKEHGTLLEFMGHLRQLANQNIGQAAHAEKDAVTISTIHQAKGAEWPVVFIPQVNQGTIPFLPERAEASEELTAVLAEERRLFYVAITRTREQLYLHLLKREPVSRFLTESGYRAVIDDVPAMQKALTVQPQKWQANEALLLSRQIPDYHLQRYFQNWWSFSETQQAEIAHRLQQFLIAAREQHLWSELKLAQNHLDLWQAISPLPENGSNPLNFPGLAKLKRQNRQSKIVNRQSKVSNLQSPISEPDLIMPGMWVQCDAGWGQIEEILDLVKRPLRPGSAQALPSTERTNTFVRYRIVLRPEQDAEPIEIDVSASRIKFVKAKKVYTCSKCQLFSAGDVEMITAVHNEAAHDGISPAYKSERKPERKLTKLVFSTEPPE